MERLLRRKCIEVLVTVIALHIALGFNSSECLSAMPIEEVLEGTSTTIMPNALAVLRRYERLQIEESNRRWGHFQFDDETFNAYGYPDELLPLGYI